MFSNWINFIVIWFEYIYIHFLYYYVSGIRYDFLSACEALLKEWLNLSHEATEVF